MKCGDCIIGWVTKWFGFINQFVYESDQPWHIEHYNNFNYCPECGHLRPSAVMQER